jgi:hypothetical protein
LPPAQQVVPAVQHTWFDPLPQVVPWLLGMQVLVLGLQHWPLAQSLFVAQEAALIGRAARNMPARIPPKYPIALRRGMGVASARAMSSIR